MKYIPLPPQVYIENRKRYEAQLLPDSLAVFHSNDIMPTNADGTMPFKQNSDLFYLSGIDQEETVLLLAPDYYDPEYREILFVRETSPVIAIWEGKKLNKEEASEKSGIRKVMWSHEFMRVFHLIAKDSDHLYLNTNEHTRATSEVQTRDARFIKYVKEAFPLHDFRRSAPIMHQLRSIKSPLEIEAIKKACEITKKAFLRVLDAIKPGISEHEIEAEIWHEFLINRSRGPAYYPIIASGAGSCVLHYNDNDKICKEGDILLMDFGAEYANYAADLTRSVPVSGIYTERQKAVYQAVLLVMREAIKMLVSGNTLDAYHEAVGFLMEEQLIKLGLLNAEDVKKQSKESPLYKKYFMHGTSHHLGLDVHDVGKKSSRLESGMVFTCEPGIYIPKEELGIRIENDILISDHGPIDLMADIPVEISEIEALMRKNS